MKDKPSMTRVPFDSQGFPRVQKRKPICIHKYKTLSSDTETIYSDVGVYVTNISAVFFCEKCLDIQHKKESINDDIK